MTKINDVGPPFPDPSRASGNCMDVGMSLRDWFAWQAMPVVFMTASEEPSIPGETLAQKFARLSYVVADAMLAARGSAHD